MFPIPEYPEHLWLLAALPLLALLLLAYWWWRRKALRQLGEIKLMERLLPGFSAARFWLKNGLVGLGLFFLSLAWANPQLGAKKQTVAQQSADVFLALDISQSMWSKDVAPSRLELAQRFGKSMVKALEGERIGLILFAGDAFLQMPLSTDYDFALQSLQTASPELISEQGTAIPAAIDLAGASFDADKGGSRLLILITDGENHDDEALDRAKAAAADGLIICTVGVGTVEGG
ncbi:MAG: VWA domain-containing protein, partial [Saprospiraceae bacterium]